MEVIRNNKSFLKNSLTVVHILAIIYGDEYLNTFSYIMHLVANLASLQQCIKFE